MIQMKSTLRRRYGLNPRRAVWIAPLTWILVCSGCLSVQANIQHTSHGRKEHSESEVSKQDADSSEKQASTGHICTRECLDHYFDGKKLVTIEGHTHEPGCGHAWDGEHWVAVYPAQLSGPTAHVCTEECENHYREGDRIITIYMHKHKPGCGHLFDGISWLRVVETPKE